jgi:uncharacterized phage protein gp47/JayE
MKITALITPGQDDEDTEHFRRRYFDSLEVQSYGGNIRDYQRMLLSVQGVTGVKVEPAWNGAGTVRVIIQDYRGIAPVAAFTNQVINAIDPPLGSGRGEGLAPIGHRVTVAGVRNVTVNTTAAFTLVAGLNFDDVRPDLESIIERYLSELRANWSQLPSIIVRTSQIEARILNESGGKIIDIAELRINNFVAGRNLALMPNDVPVRGTVNHG